MLGTNANKQNLGVYWDPTMAALLEMWGEGNVWNEIQLRMANGTGRVLDIACETGKAMQLLSDNPSLESWGFDISDLLIERACEHGFAKGRSYVGDATKLPCQDGYFDHSYSIGSIEHFTERASS